MTIYGHFFYIIYTYLFGYNSCLANMMFALDHNNSFIEVLVYKLE